MSSLEKIKNRASTVLSTILVCVGWIYGAVLVVVFCFVVIFPPIYRATGTVLGPCVEVKQIVQIGGCNSWGVCGVAFHDRTIGEAKKPVRGQIVCVRKSF
jgi:hypothetical protein